MAAMRLYETESTSKDAHNMVQFPKPLVARHKDRMAHEAVWQAGHAETFALLCGCIGVWGHNILMLTH